MDPNLWMALGVSTAKSLDAEEQKKNRRRLILIGSGLLVAGLIIGIMIGKHSKK